MKAQHKSTGRRFFGRIRSVCALCALVAAPALGQEGTGKAEQRVEVTDYDTVTLAVQDTDLAQVLEMLSIQSHKNIITSKNVSATISANLYDVTFYEALDAILKVNGYDYIEDGNFIYIYTQAEMAEMEAAKRKTESRIFELDYLSATDANEFILPLLSDAGKSSFRGEVEPGIKPDTSNVGEDSYAFTAKLVVNDYPDNLERIAAMLKELDMPPQQVLIEATILQASLDEANAFGIDFSILADLDFLDLTNPLSGVNNLLAGDDEANGFQPEDNQAFALQQTVGGTAGPGGLKIGFMDDDLSVFLRVLDQVTDTTVLSRPKIMCLNRQRAEVLVGRRVGYLSTTATETTTTQTVEFLDTGIQLMFRPFIARNGMIRMELYPSVSEASLRTVTDAQGLQVTIPDELTNELTTNVRIKDGQTLVLGGLFRESTSITRRQVPLLGDIPILGAAFRGQDDTVGREEIMFLITPSIVHDDVLWAMGEDALVYGDRAQVGARQGLLPFSRDKQTMNYNQRAVEAFNRGDVDKALYYINNSLRLDSAQPEMLKFRERVIGNATGHYERSLLERTVREKLGGMPADDKPQANAGFTGVPGEETAFFNTTFGQAAVTAESTGTADQTPRVVRESVKEASEMDPFAEEADASAPQTIQTADAFTAGVNGTSSDPAETATADTNGTSPSEGAASDADGTSLAEGDASEGIVLTDEQRDRLIDRFIHEYFTALGLAYLSPFADETTADGEFAEPTDGNLADAEPEPPLD
jgi:type IV pilus assembly protein PilQ